MLMTEHLRKAVGQDEILPMDVTTAKAIWHLFRLQNGRKTAAPLLTQPDGNTKFLKDQRVVTYGLSLAPHRDGGWNVCPNSTPTCRRGCVSYSGKGGLSSVRQGRALRTRFLATHPEAFVAVLMDEISKAWRKYGTQLRVRLNTFSDLPWETITPWLFERFPCVRFYDYTKVPNRLPPSNYRLTWSCTERHSIEYLEAITGWGYNVAVVMAVTPKTALPATWHGMAVVDGDASDDRWGDPTGVIVGLRAKGGMRGDTSGFVRSPESVGGRMADVSVFLINERPTFKAAWQRGVDSHATLPWLPTPQPHPHTRTCTQENAMLTFNELYIQDGVGDQRYMSICVDEVDARRGWLSDAHHEFVAQALISCLCSMGRWPIVPSERLVPEGRPPIPEPSTFSASGVVDVTVTTTIVFSVDVTTVDDSYELDESDQAQDDLRDRAEHIITESYATLAVDAERAWDLLDISVDADMGAFTVEGADIQDWQWNDA